MTHTNSIIDDLRAGASPILLSDVPSLSCIPRPRGRLLSRSAVFRWVLAGKGGVKLESIRTASGLATTRPAVARFFAALSGGCQATSNPLPPISSAVQHQHAAAKARLEAQGIGGSPNRPRAKFSRRPVPAGAG